METFCRGRAQRLDLKSPKEEVEVVNKVSIVASVGVMKWISCESAWYILARRRPEGISAVLHLRITAVFRPSLSITHTTTTSASSYAVNRCSQRRTQSESARVGPGVLLLRPAYHEHGMSSKSACHTTTDDSLRSGLHGTFGSLGASMTTGCRSLSLVYGTDIWRSGTDGERCA
jgi:hypothetical protein